MEKKITTPQPPKLSVTPEAENLLSGVLEKINRGFLGGKVSKLDLASWSILTVLEDMTEAKIERVRKAFFNELTYLESVVKLTRQTGQDQLPAEHLATLQQLFNQRADKSKPKPRKEPEPGEL